MGIFAKGSNEEFATREFVPIIIGDFLPPEDLETYESKGRTWLREHPGVWIEVGEFKQYSLNTPEFEVVKSGTTTYARYVGTGK